ncbi:Restriction endonuclease type IV, Mrr [Caulobacteraceae bacterium]
MTEAKKRDYIVRAPLYPTYVELGSAIATLNGKNVRVVRDLINAIFEQTGTPQNPVNWLEPDVWINERLTGDLQVLAHEIWRGSNKMLNPRHLYGSYLFINRLNLLNQTGGTYSLGERGQKFLEKDTDLLRELDVEEGIPKVLALIAERSPCKRGDIIAAWSDYLKAVSQFGTPSTFKDTLSRRIRNATERGLIEREGSVYKISSAGLDWLKGFAGITPISAAPPSPKRATVLEVAVAQKADELVLFKARLMDLDAEQFEHFVKELLEAMDYEDVIVTKYSGDKGVDVVARVQFGISEITEVVQVKRTEANIGRPKVDELRGALPYHKAIRGTIISLGSFSAGAQEGALFVGAAPITLIDGKRLLDLCIKHEVGIKRRQIEIYEIDEAFFAEKFRAADDAGGDINTGGDARPDTEIG